MSSMNDICRNILDTRDVVNQKITELLLTELLVRDDGGDGPFNRDELGSLSQRIEQILHEQTDGLIDRILDLSK